MNSLNKETMMKSSMLGGTYCLTALFFSILCGYRIIRLLQPAPGVLAVFCISAFIFTALVFLYIKCCRSEENGSKLFFILITALFCTYGFSFQFEVEKSVGWILIYGSSAVFINYALSKRVSAKVTAASLLLAVLFSCFIFVGYQLETYGRLEICYILSEPARVLRMLVCFASQLLFLAIFFAVLFTRLLVKENSTALQMKNSAVTIVMLTLGMLLCWLPYYYAFYPGNLSPDSLRELEQQLGLSPLSNHHPYMHQLLIALCLKLGAGSIDAGVGIYTALQMLLLALCFAFCVWYLGKTGSNKIICVVSFCFFALFPVNAFYSVTMWKDVLHGAITLVLMMLLVSESKEGGKKRALTTRSLLLVFVAFLFCTLRNNGWHAFVLGFPLYIIFNRKDWKRLSILFIAVAVLMNGYNHLLFDVMNLKKSASGETLSVPLQQIARTAKQNPEELRTGEFLVLSEVFPDIENLGEKYISFISDPVKAPGTFDSEAFDADPVRYMKAWAKLGIRHPLTYVEAFLLQCYGYWYPDVDYWIVHNTIEDNNLGLEHIEERSHIRYELGMLTKDLSRELPTSILFSLGLMVWLIIIAAALLCLKGEGRLASPLCIMGMLWLTTLASPVYCEYRYLYGLVVSVPLFLGMALCVKSKTE